jgi:transcriptional regulator of acetoin/glycerol metabolism
LLIFAKERLMSTKPLMSVMIEAEKKYLETVLDHTKWNLAWACRILQITRATLYKKIKYHELKN